MKLILPEQGEQKKRFWEQIECLDASIVPKTASNKLNVKHLIIPNL